MVDSEDVEAALVLRLIGHEAKVGWEEVETTFALNAFDRDVKVDCEDVSPNYPQVCLLSEATARIYVRMLGTTEAVKFVNHDVERCVQ